MRGNKVAGCELRVTGCGLTALENSTRNAELGTVPIDSKQSRLAVTNYLQQTVG